MQLLSLSFSATLSSAPTGAGAAGSAPSRPLIDGPCAFCGIRSGAWQTPCPTVRGEPCPACPLCALPGSLHRPRIDEEAALAWLPEMSQAAVITVMREIHMQLRDLGEGLHADERFRLENAQRRTLHHARAALAERTAPAAMRLGTHLPSELRSALLRLSPGAYGRRDTLLGGLRLLPLGRLYEAGQDVYPAIVDVWLDRDKPLGQRAKPVTAPIFDRRR